MAYPGSTDSLTNRPTGSETRSQDPNDAYAALRDLRTKLGDLASVPDDLLDNIADDSLLLKTGGSWGGIPRDTYRRDDTPLRAGAGELEAVSGSPSIVRVNFRWAARAFGDSSVMQVASAITVPETWNTWNLEIWHTTSSGNSGDIKWTTRVYGPSAGDALNTEDDLGTGTLAAVATAGTLGITTLRSGITAVSGINLLHFQRDGGDTADTLMGDVLILALVFRKAS